MIDDAYPSSGRPRRRGERPLILSSVAMVAAAVFGRILLPADAPPAATARPESTTTPAAERSPSAVSGRLAWILDPAPALGSGTPRLGREMPVRTGLARNTMSTSTPAALPDTATPVQAALVPAPRPQPQRFVQTVPLPKPRPSDLRETPVRLAEHAGAPRSPLAAREDAQAERSFFETVFGAKPSTGPTLAYAPLDSDAVDPSPRRALGLGPAPTASGTTAVYDISARTVSLPSGEKLEAHSGLGASQDDPRFVHLRMRGATPPGSYDLTEREALFHGVRAIRLNPLGGSAAVFGRNGLLAHTYMLGRSGASNGCISFKNYNRFLQAYLRGEVQRVVVVAGAGKERFPSVAEAPPRRAGRYAQAGDDR